MATSSPRLASAFAEIRGSVSMPDNIRLLVQGGVRHYSNMIRMYQKW